MKKYKVLKTFSHRLNGEKWVTWENGQFISKEDIAQMNKDARRESPKMKNVGDEVEIISISKGRRHKEIEPKDFKVYELHWTKDKKDKKVLPLEIPDDVPESAKEEVKSVKFTEKGAFALTKSEQVKIIKEAGLIPANKEAGRVKQILELQ